MAKEAGGAAQTRALTHAMTPESREAERVAAAKPKMSLLHHIAAMQAMETGFAVTLIDGTSYRADRGDFVFLTDGLSMVAGRHRRYFPLTAIREITISNPGES
jgi:hypothetical protein